MIKEIIEYKKVLNELPEKLANSPYKMGYIVKQTGITPPTFYRKLKNQTWTAEEVLKIAEILEPKEAYINELMESLNSAREQYENGNVREHQEVMQELKAKFTK